MTAGLSSLDGRRPPWYRPQISKGSQERSHVIAFFCVLSLWFVTYVLQRTKRCHKFLIKNLPLWVTMFVTFLESIRQRHAGRMPALRQIEDCGVCLFLCLPASFLGSLCASLLPLLLLSDSLLILQPFRNRTSRFEIYRKDCRAGTSVSNSIRDEVYLVGNLWLENTSPAIVDAILLFILSRNSTYGWHPSYCQ